MSFDGWALLIGSAPECFSLIPDSNEPWPCPSLLTGSGVWRRAASGRETLPFSDIAYGFGSPGLIFKLDENSLTERLERLERLTDGRMAYTETAESAKCTCEAGC